METECIEMRPLSAEEVVHEARKAAGCEPGHSLIERCGMLAEYWDRMHLDNGDGGGPVNYTACATLETTCATTVVETATRLFKVRLAERGIRSTNALAQSCREVAEILHGLTTPPA